MERIEEAIRKAKVSPKRGNSVPGRHDRTKGSAYAGMDHLSRAHMSQWNPPWVELDAAHLQQHRIVTHAMTDPSHVAFKILRTKLSQMMTENNWTSIAVTSPGAACGKTVVSVNLAFGLARQTDCTTVLVDLDLKKSSVARTMGIRAQSSIADYLRDEAELEDCFVQADDNLFVGLNHHPVRNFSEMAGDPRVKNILPTVMAALQPKVVIFDLPPVLSGDEVMAYAPQVDCALLVAAAGKTQAKEIEECENQLESAVNFLGVVLNKCTDKPTESYQYEIE